MSNNNQDLIGHAPEPISGPQFVLPFRRQDEYVEDAVGRTFAETSYCSTTRDDYDAAEIVKDALNAKFGVTESGLVEPETEAFTPRVLFRKEVSGDVERWYSGAIKFAYEVAPGRFWWAESRAQAVSETRGENRGWFVGGYQRLYDVTDPNGSTVTG